MDDKVAFKDAVEATGNLIKDAVAHGDVPFEDIIDACCASRSTAYSPIAQVLLTVLSSGKYFKNYFLAELK